MKSNSSNEKSRIHLNWFNFSRKNSPEEEVNMNSKSVDFQNAYNKIFCNEKEDKFIGNDLHKNVFLEDESEMATKQCHTERRFENCPKYSDGLMHEKNEINIKQASSSKYFYLDYKNVDQILNNSKDDFEQKNIKLAKFLIEINNISKSADLEEMKSLMQIQAKILESMITLTKHSQVVSSG